MTYFPRIYAVLATAAWSGNVLAADTPAVSPSGGLLQIIMALLLVLALVVAAAWVMKRLGPIQGGNKIQVKIIGGINVGNRERVMVVEVADQWLILGVTANNINNLGSMPKQEELLLQAAQAQTNDPFSAWLKRTLDKRSTERSENK
ncbi:flagellar biosynthetic protein FliO [Undibacterium sp. Di26W]|uniref:flagellar biosynthetic protein FliO n=1 Tax=Undibacterium sp. Di26W TaxID=3413035 RepID=UPI003BF0D3FC